MIGLDTNVLVRYLAQDDPKQALQATRLIEHELTAATPGFISLVVLAELCWVLTRLYGASPDEIKQTVEDLLGTLDGGNVELAADIASVPEHIRGYGHVKEAHFAKAKAREAELLAAWRTPAKAVSAA